MVTHKVSDLPTCLEEKYSLGESSTSCEEVLNTNDMKMSEVSKVMTKAEIKPKSMHRAKIWSDDVENLYRFQQAGYRDEVEYKQVKQVDKALHTHGSLGNPVQCPLFWLPQPALAQTLSLFQGRHTAKVALRWLWKMDEPQRPSQLVG
ncbi:meiosis expressed gene 1 protein homolog isoform X3 [Oenanthe melanoleuca]|nr:meiosis expressed gene 1 protein homolog isoform X3 [Oenanthe melanoleuca]